MVLKGFENFKSLMFTAHRLACESVRFVPQYKFIENESEDLPQTRLGSVHNNFHLHPCEPVMKSVLNTHIWNKYQESIKNIGEKKTDIFFFCIL